MKIFNYFIILLFISACSALPNYYMDSSLISEKTECSYDKFTSMNLCQSPSFKNTEYIEKNDSKVLQEKEDKLFGIWGPNMSFKTYCDKNNRVNQIYFMSANNDWIFYSGAYDEYGNVLDFVEIDRSVKNVFGQVLVTEEFGINVSLDYLLKYKDTNKGLDIKLVGKNGYYIYTIQPTMIDAFVMQIKNMKC